MQLPYLFPSFSWILFGVVICSACSSAPKGDPVRVGDKEKAAEKVGQVYTPDTSASLIHFVGSGVGKSHPGSFHLSSGSLAVANSQVTGGEFTIDINSLALDEPEKVIQQTLRPHLLSADFFEAEKFETALFVITQVAPYRSSGSDTSIVQGANFSVSGNLTLKKTTRNITFPAKIELTGNTLRADANLNIDRTQWNVNYHGEKSLKNKFISETVNVRLNLVARHP